MRILYFPKTTSAFTECALSLTPKVFQVKDSLYLDIEPTLKYFKGEENIFLKAMELASRFSLANQFVLTDRPEWAQALHTRAEVFIPAGKSFDYLINLDISRLEWIGDPYKLTEEKKERIELIRFMKRVGLKSIGDFTRLTATAIGRRFGRTGIFLLDWVLGNKTLPLPVFVPEGLISETINTEEISSLETLLNIMPEVLTKIEFRLKARNQAIKSLELKFYLESKNSLTKLFHFADPTQKSETVLRLLKELLNEVSWDSPLQSLDITINETVPFLVGQLSLFETGENSFFDLSQYLTRLRNKYGESQVGFPALKESFIPERSWATSWPPEQTDNSYSTPHRPLFLFDPPRPCHPLNSWKLIPSENLMTEWWSPNGFRKYFIAAPPTGNRLWIYWDLEEKVWYAHGTFD